jgi:hypothetical protein
MGEVRPAMLMLKLGQQGRRERAGEAAHGDVMHDWAFSFDASLRLVAHAREHQITLGGESYKQPPFIEEAHGCKQCVRQMLLPSLTASAILLLSQREMLIQTLWRTTKLLSCISYEYLCEFHDTLNLSLCAA